jgi:DNA end-binding protein Ku
MRKKEYLAALHAHNDVICLYTMRFADEVIQPDTLPGIEGDVNINDKELKMATELIGSLADKFDPEEFHDQYRKHVEELIERKAKGEEIVEQPEPEERPHKVINLMAALQKSLDEAKKSRRGIPHHSEQEPTRRRKAG